MGSSIRTTRLRVLSWRKTMSTLANAFKNKWYYVYYKMENGQWVIEAVHPEGEKRPPVYTSRSIIPAVDELGAFQKVNTWLQKSNAALAEQEAW
jgi:hypothetical protein